MEELIAEYADCLADIEVAKKRQAKELAKRKGHEERLELIRVKIENEAAGNDYKSGTGTVTHRKGTPKAVIDESQLDKKWYITKETTTLSRQAVLASLKMGEEIKGATLSNGAPTLMIKVL